MSQEEINRIYKMLSCDNCPTSYACEACDITWTDKQLLKRYIDQLEQENKALKKGQASLMASRKKWRYRYYNLKAKNKKDIEGWENVLDCAKFEINKREEENNKQSKIIDEMSMEIASYDNDETFCKEVYPNNSCEGNGIPCWDCIKQYFEKKVEGK